MFFFIEKKITFKWVYDMADLIAILFYQAGNTAGSPAKRHAFPFTPLGSSFSYMGFKAVCQVKAKCLVMPGEL